VTVLWWFDLIERDKLCLDLLSSIFSVRSNFGMMKRRGLPAYWIPVIFILVRFFALIRL
jgi:hypothetical protein